MNRRIFIKNIFGIAGVGIAAPTVIRTLFTSKAYADDLSLPFVEPGKGTAAALNYVDDKSKLKDAKLKVEKMGVAFDKQDCSGCMFYKNVGKKNGKDVGTCTIFPKQLVKGTSWCSSWTKKS